MSSIVLGKYQEPFELYGAYQVLLRALIEAKFSAESFDDRILHSETLAQLGNELVEKMDRLGEEIKINSGGAQRKWLTIDSKSHRVYQNLLEKLPKDFEDENLQRYFDRLSTEGRLNWLRMLLAPYTITERAAFLFFEDLFKDGGTSRKF